MKPGKNREELQDALIIAIDKIKHDKDKVEKIKKGLYKHYISGGDVQNYINNAETELKKIDDLRLLCLLTEQLYVVSGDLSINPNDYFTKVEIKKSKEYVAIEEEDKLEFPIVLDNVMMVDEGSYITFLDVKFIKKLLDSQILRYNFDTQREARFVKRRGSVERVAKVNQKSVKEIAQLLLDGMLEITTLTFNALVGRAESGEELIYDARKMQLTITEGSFLDILDGYHRILGTIRALEMNPNIDFKFQVAIKNFNITKAQRHLAQISKINEISRVHIQALEASRYADTVVKHLREESDLRGRISQTNRVNTSVNNELVSYNTLADTIEEEFKMVSRKEAMDVANYLTDFFDYLIGSFPNEFIENVQETKENSLINENQMFAGYIILARKLKEENMTFTYISDIIKSIDFSKNNPLWEKEGILTDGKINQNTRKNIKKFFRELDIKGIVKGGVKVGQ